MTSMANGSATIIELRLDAGGLCGKITCPPALRPASGQYLAASSHDPGEAFPSVLFPSGFANGALSIAAPLPSHWKIGMDLWLRGPLGKGFAMPSIARRVALAGLDGSPARLLPLAYQALAQRAAVTIYAADAPAGLPAEVEILPLELLPEAPQWADFLAVDIAQAGLPHLRNQLGLAPYQRLACQAQVLVVTPMPCCGLAECGVCAVHTRDKWASACVDGPVFDFQQLELAG